MPDLRLHDLRATFSSELQRQGVSLSIAQALLEHSDPSTTEKWYTNVDSSLSDAVTKLPLDKWIKEGPLDL